MRGTEASPVTTGLWVVLAQRQGKDSTEGEQQEIHKRQVLF